MTDSEETRDQTDQLKSGEYDCVLTTKRCQTFRSGYGHCDRDGDWRVEIACHDSVNY